MSPRLLFAVLAAPLIVLALAACGRPTAKQWTALGGCVWDRLPADDRAGVVAAVENGRPLPDGGGETLRDRTRELAFACHPGAQLDGRRAAQIVGWTLKREAAAELLARHLRLDRRRLEVAVDMAPPDVKRSLSETGMMAAVATGPAVLMTSLSPIQANLGLPQDDAWADTKEGAWLTQFVVADAAIRALSEGGARP